MHNNEKYKLFCLSMGEALNEVIIEAMKKKKDSESNFNSGYLCGLHRVVTLMQQHAEIFEISFNDIGVDFDETDLI